MAVKKNAPLQRIELDPAVQAYMTNDRQSETDVRRQREMSLTKYQRRKRKFDKARTKATYDLSADIKDHLAKIAQDESVPVSHLASLFLHNAIQLYEMGEFDLDEYKVPSRHPAFQSSLEIQPQNGWSRR